LLEVSNISVICFGEEEEEERIKNEFVPRIFQGRLTTLRERAKETHCS
jgi:hypothetical protein